MQEVLFMEQDELNRWRNEFERLYRSPDFEPIANRPLTASADRPQGWWQKLQLFWHQMGDFFTETDGSAQSDPLWWQVHGWRTGVQVLGSENLSEAANRSDDAQT
jgi:hypothetical protein